MKKLSGKKGPISLIIVILNIALLVCAILLYGRYVSVYRERLREENLGNIANLNQSAASNATSLITSWNIKLEDIAQYVDRKGATAQEALELICDSNSNGDRLFELIGSDYTGHLAQKDENGDFIPLSYQKSSYAELQKAFNDLEDDAYGDVRFAPEFTDGYTALKNFAIYRHLTLSNSEGQPEHYTLLLATKSKDVLAVFNEQNDFEGQSTVLIDSTGNYIVSSNDFKSTNFFQYLYVYNDLSLDERNSVQLQVETGESGELYYKNAAGQSCVFRYERMSTNNWYCVTCVPISSFRTPVFDTNYALFAVAALLALMLMDVAWLWYTNRRLRLSAEREKEASSAKTDFLSRMSHDIRTPLNGIIVLTTLALDENNSPRTQEYLDNIKVSGQFLSGLVNDILDMSKVESGKVELHPEPYSSRDLYKYVDSVVKPLCMEKGLDFRITEPDELPPVLLDRLRFNQVVFNLLSNAVKYTPSGGLVELCWKRSPLPDGRAVLELTVRDNGIGMSEEFQQHMFESFSQEHAQTANTGSGLGLAIVSSLVKLMNGSISVTSRKGAGSSFTVRLETGVCSADDSAPEKADTASLEGLRVLLCEDNQINILFINRLLEKWGVSVDVAANGRLGVEKFMSSGLWEYDAVLMDVMMPEMNGMDAARAIRAMERPDARTLPIIAMTANAYDTDVQNCLDAGMSAHMGKPIDSEQLKALLCQLTGVLKKK